MMNKRGQYPYLDKVFHLIVSALLKLNHFLDTEIDIEAGCSYIVT